METGRGLLLFGSGEFRKSDVYLAFQSEARIEDREGILFLQGLRDDGTPIWSSREEDGVPLFRQPTVGELSVTYNQFLRRWILLYNAGGVRRGINLRTAQQPWGPWSEAQVLFHPWKDGGYCHFMHASWKHRKYASSWHRWSNGRQRIRVDPRP